MENGAAKLARLMSGLPQYLEPLRLAESEETVAGTVRVGDLRRLNCLLYDTSGSVTFRLKFGRNEQGFVSIQGGFSTSLTVPCQRCLEPLEISLERSIQVALVSKGTEAEQLHGEVEPLTLPDQRLHLLSFIEDEVLLALPMAPRHETAQCPAGRLKAAATEPKQSPFAVLKDMQAGKA